MSKETEFIERATNIIFNSCRDSMATVKVGDTIFIDDSFKYDFGTHHKWCAGDEFLVQLVERTPYGNFICCVATKKHSDCGSGVRGAVGDEVNFDTKMPLFEYLRIKGDMTVKNNLRKLCRDYLDGL